eukprot:GEMP01048625.1.p1 GENE.GEMP01048625.1~~GEMP01048625.1.p1  ORF type:complete len:348 (+),score=53.78 GEMP01048625.1:87-1130(+)
MVHGFLVLFYAIWCFATPSDGTSKFDVMHRKRSQSETGIIRLGPKDYKTYVLRQPRPYSIFVCLLGPLTKFPVLRGFEVAFTKVSLAYKFADVVHENQTQDVFFVIADVFSNQEISQWHDIENIPVLAHVGPNMWKSQKEASSHPINSESEYSGRGKKIVAQDLLNWANSFTQANVEPHVSFSDRFKESFFSVCLVLLCISTLAMGITAIRWFPKLMIAAAFGLHCLAVSGIVSNIIEGRGPPGRGAPFFMPGMRGQFMHEGVAVAITTIIPSLCLIALLNVHKFLTTPETLSSVQLTLIFVAGASSQLLVYFFKLKGGWYSDPPFFPLADFKRGSIYVDQGNTIFD